jgi:tRNA threonylcarbamoyladenosine biosynthesis protein TsaE
MSDPDTVRVPDAKAMRELGAQLARRLSPGALVVLTGPLGAGKTTFTQGLAEGLQVRGPITSPTFVLARVHPSLVGGPDLVHADAYRLGSVAELDDLDLDSSVAESVTVVEWGAGKAEVLAASGDRPGQFWEVFIQRDADSEERLVRIELVQSTSDHT